MPGTRFRLFLAAILLTLVTSVAAEETYQPIPQGIRGYLSISSLDRALKDVDGFVTAITAGKNANYAPGFLPMMFQMMNPIPANAWDTGSEAFALALDKSLEQSDMPVLIVSVEDFEESCEAMEAAGVAVQMLAEDQALMQIPDGRVLFAADLGDGQMLLAFALNPFNAALEELGDWRPKHYGKGSVSFLMRAEAALDNAMPQLEQARDAVLSLEPEQVAADLAADPRVPEQAVVAVEGALRLLQQYYPDYVWFDHIQDFGFTLDLDSRRIALGYAFIPKANSYLSAMAEHMARQEAVNGALLKNAGEEAVMAMVTAPLSAYFPDAENLGKRIITEICDAVFPGERDAALAIFAQIVAADVGEMVIDLALPEGRPMSVVTIEAGDTDRLLTGVVAALEKVGALSEGLLHDPRGYVGLRVERGEVDGLSCYRAGLHFVDGDAPATDSAAQMRDLLTQAVDLLLAANSERLVIGNENQPDAWLAALAEPGASGFLSGAAAAPLDEIGPSQKLALIKVAKSARAIADFAIANGELGEEEAARLLAVFNNEDELIYFGAGAEEGRLKAEIIVDTATINRIWQAVRMHQKAGRRK